MSRPFDEHLVESGADGHHVVAVTSRSSASSGLGRPGDLAAWCQQCGGGAGGEETEERNGGELVGGESEQQCSGHAIRFCSAPATEPNFCSMDEHGGRRRRSPSPSAPSRDRRGVAGDRARRRGAQRRRRRPAAQNRQADHRPLGAPTPLEHAVLGAVRRRRRRRGDARTDRRQRAPLRAAAAWFEVLKRERRRLRITTGNAQELYFPVCFELAVTKGAPARRITTRRRGAAGHSRRPRPHRDRGPQPVRGRPAVIAELSEQLRHSWRDVRAGPRSPARSCRA